MAVIDNLVAYWSLEETSGTRIDAHAANDLTDNNAVGSGTGKVGTANDFVLANNEYLSLADNTDVSITGNFSIAGWFKLDDVGGTLKIIACQDDFNTNRGYYIAANTTVIQCQVTDSSSGNSFAQTGGVLSATTWHHFVMTYTASDKIARIRVDDTTTATGGALTNGPRNSTAAFAVGAISAGGGNFMDGLIDELGMWHKVLSASEITWLYNSGIGRSYADIVAEAGGGAAPVYRGVPFIRF